MNKEKDLLTQPVDWSNFGQIAKDLWLFLTNDTMPECARIKKAAFLHEVEAVLITVAAHLQAESERLKGEVSYWVKATDVLANAPTQGEQPSASADETLKQDRDNWVAMYKALAEKEGQRRVELQEARARLNFWKSKYEALEEKGGIK